MGCKSSKSNRNNDKEISISNIERFPIRNNKINKNKVISEIETHKLIAENNLKVALTHPTVIKYLKDYMIQQNTANLLDFYIKANEIRNLYKEIKKNNNNKDLEVLYTNFQNLLKRYVLLTVNHNDNIVPMTSHHRNLILLNVNSDGSVIPNQFPNAIEGLRLAQYHIFFSIKESSWLPFCSTEQYTIMMKKKEVRTLLSLYNTNSTSKKQSKLQFSEIMHSEVVQNESNNNSIRSNGGKSYRSTFLSDDNNEHKKL